MFAKNSQVAKRRPFGEFNNRFRSARAGRKAKKYSSVSMKPDDGSGPSVASMLLGEACDGPRNYLRVVRARKYDRR
jgi:hypothetical protein